MTIKSSGNSISCLDKPPKLHDARVCVRKGLVGQKNTCKPEPHVKPNAFSMLFTGLRGQEDAITAMEQNYRIPEFMRTRSSNEQKIHQIQKCKVPTPFDLNKLLISRGLTPFSCGGNHQKIMCMHQRTLEPSNKRLNTKILWIMKVESERVTTLSSLQF